MATVHHYVTLVECESCSKKTHDLFVYRCVFSNPVCLKHHSVCDECDKICKGKWFKGMYSSKIDMIQQRTSHWQTEHASVDIL